MGTTEGGSLMLRRPLLRRDGNGVIDVLVADSSANLTGDPAVRLRVTQRGIRFNPRVLPRGSGWNIPNAIPGVAKDLLAGASDNTFFVVGHNRGVGLEYVACIPEHMRDHILVVLHQTDEDIMKRYRAEGVEHFSVYGEEAGCLLTMV